MIYEWSIARRYLMPEGRFTFVFVMALLSILGVGLGVAALITVLSVMNGFGDDLRAKILEGKAHLHFVGYADGVPDIPEIVSAFEAEENVAAAAPVVEAYGLLQADSYNDNPQTVVVYGIEPERQDRISQLSGKLLVGSLDSLRVPPRAATADPGKKIPITQLRGRKEESGIVIGRELARALFAVWSEYNASEEETARSMEMALGRTVTIMTMPSVSGVAGPEPRRRRFTVTGVFATGHYEFDRAMVYISKRAAQYLCRRPRALTHIALRLEKWDPDSTYNTARSIGETRDSLLVDTETGTMIDLRKPENAEWLTRLQQIYDETEPGEHPADLDSVVRLRGYTDSWMQFNRIFFEALVIEKKMMGYILAIIVLVATFNILTTLLMVVMIKTRDIGVLRALGASRGGILRIFVAVGLFIGVLGTAFGVALGLGLCAFISQVPIELPGQGQIYYVPYLPVAVKWLDVVNVTVYAICISFLSTIIPALRASRLEPTRCLRAI